MEQVTQWLAFPGDDFQSAMALAIAVGTLYCFLGYRVFRLTLGLTGFLLAGSVAAGLVALLSRGNPVYATVALVLGGISGAMALVFVYKAGAFCVGVLGGVVVAMHFIPDRSQGWELWAVLGAGVGAGAVALVLERPIMTVATAAIGAWALVMGLSFFLLGREAAPSPENPVPAGEYRLYYFAAWLALTLIGAFFQITGRRPKKAAKEAE